ncbi:hypothetical protein BT63DRAFT_425557 [Microthyrium microscopicum]|uniref:Tetraspanin Tsp3 n=1 Tax=Microthyrium microscopicum TaxID=703497 RepID=A0A6A6UA97_9PEZI|nr:hypothetical protein BT63DRAFT_425557 [Microthyrium microscopicum]
MIIKYSLPIPIVIAALTTALPTLSGFATKAFAARSTSSGLANLSIQLLFFLQAVLVALSASQLGGTDCSLHTRWQSLFRAKDEGHIRTIQDGFNCCGYANTVDMAWPFPSKTSDPRRCEETFDRTASCLDSWRGEEKIVASLLLAVNVLITLWQICVVYRGQMGGEWVKQAFGGRRGDGQRLGIGFVSEDGEYHDEPQSERQDELENGQLALNGEEVDDSSRYRVQPSLLRDT